MPGGAQNRPVRSNTLSKKPVMFGIPERLS